MSTSQNIIIEYSVSQAFIGFKTNLCLVFPTQISKDQRCLVLDSLRLQSTNTQTYLLLLRSDSGKDDKLKDLIFILKKELVYIHFFFSFSWGFLVLI